MFRCSHRVLCGTMLLLNLAGCTTWWRQRGASSVPGAETSIPQARLIMRDGSPPLTLANVTVRSDSVTGYLIDQHRSRMAFARADVVAVETRVANHVGNIGLIVLGIAGVAAVLFGLFLVAYGSSAS